jgi:hypothetical protein
LLACAVSADPIVVLIGRDERRVFSSSIFFVVVYLKAVLRAVLGVLQAHS